MSVCAQGMDPVNERHIFNLIVTSASIGAQYFLLTPKVLRPSAVTTFLPFVCLFVCLFVCQ